MINAKYIQILKTFTPDEIKLFSRFLKSKYFNSNRKLTELFSIIKNFYPGFTDRRFTKEYVFKRLYSDKAYREKKIRDLDSEMLILIQKFMGCMRCIKRTNVNDILIFDELKSKNLESILRHKIKEYDKLLNTGNVKRADYHYNKYILHKTINSFYRNQFIRKYPVDILAELENFERFTFLTKIEQYLKLLCLENDKHDILTGEELDIIQNEIKGNLSKYDETPLVRIAYLSLLLFRNNKYEYYVKLKKLLNKHKLNLDFNLRYCINKIIINYLTLHYNFSLYPLREKYQIELYKIIKEFLSEFSNYDTKFIRYSFFIDIVNVCIDSGKISEALSFVSEYNSLIPKMFCTSYSNLALAKIAFSQKDYQAALRHLAKIKRVDSIYQMEINRLTIICLIETGKFNEAVSTLSNLKILLKRSIIKSFEYYRSKDFVKYTHTLLKYISKNNLDELKILKDNLIKEVNFPFSKWMIHKINIIVNEYK